MSLATSITVSHKDSPWRPSFHGRRSPTWSGARSLSSVSGQRSASANDDGSVSAHMPRIDSAVRAFSTRKLHKRLHTHRTKHTLQMYVNQKLPICRNFLEPSVGLEPSTPSLPWRLRPLPCDLGTALDRALSL